MGAYLRMHWCVDSDEVPSCLSEDASSVRALSGGCHGAFLLSEEALEHHDLAEADDEQQDGLADGPVGHPLEEVLCF